jgi:hypothetical protein
VEQVSGGPPVSSRQSKPVIAQAAYKMETAFYNAFSVSIATSAQYRLIITQNTYRKHPETVKNPPKSGGFLCFYSALPFIEHFKNLAKIIVINAI